MAINPPAWIDGPDRPPLPYGLFSVAPPVDDDGAWAGGAGARWYEDCTLAQSVVERTCDSPVNSALPQVGSSGFGVPRSATGFVVYGSAVCTPVGGGVGEAENKALERLHRTEELIVERVFWNGNLSNTPFLTDSSVEDLPGTASFSDPNKAVGALEQFFANTSGTLGVLHMNREVASRLSYTESKNGVLYTRLGTPIVAGAGYDSTLMIITGQLIVRRTAVFTAPSQEVFNRSNNNDQAIASRHYLVGFDDCGAAAATISLA